MFARVTFIPASFVAKGLSIPHANSLFAPSSAAVIPDVNQCTMR